MRVTYIRSIDTVVISFSPDLLMTKVKMLGNASVGLSADDCVVMAKIKQVSKRPQFPEALYTFFTSESAPGMRDAIKDIYEESLRKITR